MHRQSELDQFVREGMLGRRYCMNVKVQRRPQSIVAALQAKIGNVKSFCGLYVFNRNLQVAEFQNVERHIADTLVCRTTYCRHVT
jgi:hypothetical protein